MTDSERYKTYYKDSFKETSNELYQITNKLQKDQARLKLKSTGLSKSVLTNRKACESTWDLYWKYVTNASEAEQDPYIVGRLFDRKVLRYQAVQKQYTKEMAQIFDEVLKLDEMRLQKGKEILSKYLSNLKSNYLTEIVQIERVLDKINTIDSVKDAETFKRTDNFYTTLYSNTD
eukprot:UN33267